MQGVGEALYYFVFLLFLSSPFFRPSLVEIGFLPLCTPTPPPWIYNLRHRRSVPPADAATPAAAESSLAAAPTDADFAAAFPADSPVAADVAGALASGGSGLAAAHAGLGASFTGDGARPDAAGGCATAVSVAFGSHFATLVIFCCSCC